MTPTPHQLSEKLRKAIHSESAKLSPHTSELIEVGKLVVEYLEGMAGLPAGGVVHLLRERLAELRGEAADRKLLSYDGSFPVPFETYFTACAEARADGMQYAVDIAERATLPTLPTGRSAIQSPTTGGET